MYAHSDIYIYVIYSDFANLIILTYVYRNYSLYIVILLIYSGFAIYIYNEH